ncbi:MAG: Gfo/Idh/MocA family protein [Pirellulales bacterium]
MQIHTILLFAGLLAVAMLHSHGQAEEPLRAGIIGCDTSHVIAFTKVLNDPKATGPFAEVQIVAAYPGGSDDIPSSYERVDKYSDELRGMGVTIVPSIDALLEQVDVVLVESVDGRPHLEQVRPVLAAGKRVFIDKPMAGSLADAVEIDQLAKTHGVPWFSSSSLRFSPGILGMRNDPRVGDVVGCAAYSPCSLEPHHPDLFWYGIHGVETLFTIMGTGCESVTRVHTDGTDLAVGIWEGGRVGTFRGIRSGAKGYGATVFGSKGILPSGPYAGYKPLVVEIVRFFQTGKSPVSAEETIEILAFMEAADESRRNGGLPVRIETVLKKARAEVAARTGAEK